MSHVTLEQLIALWCGDGDESVEEHAMTCDACAAAYVRLGAVCEALRAAIPPIISHAQRDRLVAGGMRIGHTSVEAGVEVDATFAPELDLLVHVLRADLTGVTRVDVTIVAPDGAPLGTLEAVPFDAQRGEVLVACQRHYADTFPHDPSFVLEIHGPAPRKAAYRVRHHFSV